MSDNTDLNSYLKTAGMDQKDIKMLQHRFRLADKNHPVTATLFNFIVEQMSAENPNLPSINSQPKKQKGAAKSIDPVSIIQSDIKLPPLPSVYIELQSLTENPDVSAVDIAEVISKDPSLAAWVLKLVNSPFFGFSIKVDTITRAVTLIGIQQIKTLLLGGMFNGLMDKLPRDILDLEEFRRHSVATAIAAQAIWKIMGRSEPERLLVAGLLHDCGILALADAFPSTFKALTETLYDSEHPRHVRENEILSFDHAKLGGMLLHRWNMPMPLVMAVLHHHKVENPERYPEAAVIHLADIIAFAVAGRTELDIVPPLDPAVWNMLGLTPANLNFVADTVLSTLNDMCMMFSA